MTVKNIVKNSVKEGTRKVMLMGTTEEAFDTTIVNQTRNGKVIDQLNVPDGQDLVIASQPNYDSFPAHTNITNVLKKPSQFRIRVETSELDMVNSLVLALEFENVLGTDIQCSTYLHDNLEYIAVSSDGVEYQRILLDAMYIQQRALQDDQKHYDDDYKPGVIMGGDLVAGTTRTLYLPIDCVISMNKVLGKAISKDITFTVQTKSTGWPTASIPELKTAEIIVGHTSFDQRENSILESKYTRSRDFKFYQPISTPISLTGIKNSQTYTYVISGLTGTTNCLSLVMKPATDSVISEWCTDYIESFELLDGAGKSVHGNMPITRDYYNRIILHGREHIRLDDPAAADQFLSLDFGDYTHDMKTGSCTGFEVMNSTHKLRLTFSAGMPDGDYELDIMTWMYKNMNIQGGRVSVSD